MVYSFLPEDLQNRFGNIAYTKIVPTPDEKKVIQKYKKFAEMNKPQV